MKIRVNYEELQKLWKVNGVEVCVVWLGCGHYVYPEFQKCTSHQAVICPACAEETMVLGIEAYEDVDSPHPIENFTEEDLIIPVKVTDVDIAIFKSNTMDKIKKDIK